MEFSILDENESESNFEWLYTKNLKEGIKIHNHQEIINLL